MVPKPDEWDSLVRDADTFLDELMRTRPLKAVSRRPVFRKAYRSRGAHFIRNGLVFSMLGVEKLLGSATQKIRIPDLTNSRGQKPITCILKSVSALGRLPLYGIARPEMPIIHIIRHPCGVVGSLLRGVKTGRMPEPKLYPPQLALPPARRRDLTEEKVERMSPLEKATWGWVILNEWAMERRPPDAHWKAFRYEDLCADPVAESRNLFAWCGLSWTKETQRFIDASLQADGSADYFKVIRNPAIAANRWQKEIPKEQIQQISDIAKYSLPGELYF